MARTVLTPAATPTGQIRNFCIIAHIDRQVDAGRPDAQITGVVDARQMREQYLDRMDIERDGITIKSQAVRMPWGSTHALRTEYDRHPGRRLQLRGLEIAGACEGAVLLTDAAQDRAQTLANLYMALENDRQSSRCSTRSTCPRHGPERTPSSSRT
jgi:GTP-binding protein LepA